MARITVDKCNEKVGYNRFLLVHLAAKRARMLAIKQDTPQVNCDNGSCVTALREIEQGYVRLAQDEDEDECVEEIDQGVPAE